MAKRRVPSPDPATPLTSARFEAAAPPPGRSEPAIGRLAGTAGEVGGAGKSGGAGGSGGGGQSVAVRVRPGAGRTRVGGRYDGPHGPALIVAVGAPAVDGKATEAVRRALADALAVRPRDVVLKLGATSRDKVFTVFGDVGARLAVLRDGST